MNTTIIKARDVMIEKHLELDGTATVKEALSVMRENDADVIIVKKRNEHDAYGIVLLVDIAKKVLAQDRSLERTNIYEIMSKPVITLEPEMNVKYCARLFDNFGLSSAPVVEAGKVLGIVGYHELVFQGLYEQYK